MIRMVVMHDIAAGVIRTRQMIAMPPMVVIEATRRNVSAAIETMLIDAAANVTRAIRVATIPVAVVTIIVVTTIVIAPAIVAAMVPVVTIVPTLVPAKIAASMIATAITTMIAIVTIIVAASIAAFIRVRRCHSPRQ